MLMPYSFPPCSEVFIRISTQASLNFLFRRDKVTLAGSYLQHGESNPACGWQVEHYCTKHIFKHCSMASTLNIKKIDCLNRPSLILHAHYSVFPTMQYSWMVYEVNCYDKNWRKLYSRIKEYTVRWVIQKNHPSTIQTFIRPLVTILLKVNVSKPNFS